LARVDRTREAELPLGALGAERSERRFVVLAGNVNTCEAPSTRFAVGQQEALLAPQPHGATIRRRLGRIYWASGLLQTNYRTAAN
jgi:hypothetical protein